MCLPQFSPHVYKRQCCYRYSTGPYGGVLGPFKTTAMESTRKSTRHTGPPDRLGDPRDSEIAIGALDAGDLLVAGASAVDVAAANVYFHDDSGTLTRHDAEIAASFAVAGSRVASNGAAAGPSRPRAASNGAAAVQSDDALIAALAAAAGPSRPRAASNGAAAVQSDDALIAALAAAAIPALITIPGSPSVTEISDDVDPNSFFVDDRFFANDMMSDDDEDTVGESASKAAAAGHDAASNGASAGRKRKADDTDDVPVFGAPAAQAAAGASFEVQADGSTARRTVVDSTGTTRVSRWTRVDGIWTKNSV